MTTSTAVDVQELVAQLPRHLREILADGPAPDPGCTACAALYPSLTSGLTTASIAAVDALFDYHAGVDLQDREGFVLCRGPEVYERCCEIYRAAGWEGEA